jgi:glycosyltransferase involved in cell wall biosynthesis
MNIGDIIGRLTTHKNATINVIDGDYIVTINNNDITSGVRIDNININKGKYSIILELNNTTGKVYYSDTCGNKNVKINNGLNEIIVEINKQSILSFIISLQSSKINDVFIIKKLQIRPYNIGTTLTKVCKINDSENKENLFNNYKIYQVQVSKSLLHFKEKFKEKYNLSDYNDQYSPTLFFGIYNSEDINKLKNHKGKRYILWGGTDADSRFKNREMILKFIKDLPDTIHFSSSQNLEQRLVENKISNKKIELDLVDRKLFKQTNKFGKKILIYNGFSKGNEHIYGSDVYEKVMDKLPNYEYIFSNTLNLPIEKMPEIYKSCCIVLRLTTNDASAQTVKECELMGLPIVHNGDNPKAIKWENENDISKTILKIKNCIDRVYYIGNDTSECPYECIQIDPKDEEINLSHHIQAYMDATSKGYSRILILEKGIIYENVPKLNEIYVDYDYDILFLGLNNCSFQNELVSSSDGSFSYIINKSVYDEIINNYKTGNINEIFDKYTNFTYNKQIFAKIGKNPIAYLQYVHYPQVLSGYTIRSHKILTSLIKHRQVIAITQNDDNSNITFGFNEKPYMINDGIIYFYLQRKAGETKTTTYVNTIVNICKKYNVQLIHSNSNHLIGTCGLQAAKILGIPSIYEVRGLWYETHAINDKSYEKTNEFKLEKEKEMYVCNNSNAVFTINLTLKQYLENNGVKNTIHIIPNGTDKNEKLTDNSKIPEKLKDLFKLKTKNNLIYLGYIGSLVSYEGIEFMIDALCSLPNRIKSKYRILVIGDDKLKIESANTNPNIIFIGRIQNEQIHHVYNILDIILFPRLSNKLTETTGPLKIVEAMGYGKICLVSNLKPVYEYVTDHKTGILFESNSEDSLRQKVIDLIDNFALYKNIGDNAKEWAIKYRSWDIISNAISNIYNIYTKNITVLAILSYSPGYYSNGYIERTHGYIKHLSNKCNIYPVTRLGFPNDRIENSTTSENVIFDGVKYYHLHNDTDTMHVDNTECDLYMTKFEEKLMGFIEKLNINLIFSTSNYINGMVASRIAKKLNIPLVYEERGFNYIPKIDKDKKLNNIPLNYLHKAILQYDIEKLNYDSTIVNEIKKVKYVYDQADHLITLSNSMKNIIKYYGINDNKIDIIENGVNDCNPYIQNLHSNYLSYFNKNIIRFAYIGSLCAYENLELAINCFHDIVKNHKITNFKYYIVGGTPGKNQYGALYMKYKQMIESLNMESYIIMTGPKYDEEYYEIVSQIDCILLTRKPDNTCDNVLPTKIFYPMLQKKLLIAPNLTTLKEFFEDKKHCVFYNKEDSNVTLTTYLINICQNRLNYVDIANNGSEFVKAKFNWEILSNKFLYSFNNGILNFNQKFLPIEDFEYFKFIFDSKKVEYNYIINNKTDLIPVIMCTYNRINYLESTILNLLAQSDKNFSFNIWNNNYKEKDTINALVDKYKERIKCSVYHSNENVGGVGRFILLQEVKLHTNSEYCIFFDDDQILPSNLIQKYKECAYGNKIFSWYGRKFSDGCPYTKFLANGKAESQYHIIKNGDRMDYGGTGGMICPMKLVSEEFLNNIKKKYQFCEDILLSFWAQQKYNYLIYKIDVDIKMIKDGKNQSFGMLYITKNELLDDYRNKKLFIENKLGNYIML